MVASNIRVFLRVRPSAKPSKSFQLLPEIDGGVSFERDREAPDGQVNNSRTTFKFKFDGILGMTITQADVFETVAKPVIEDVLNGINGTIFAYGQTGSGKTFTITGAADRYEDRGLIPRTISYMFRAFQRGDAKYQLYISYLEIYNDAGYDLLSTEDSARKLEDLPKVVLREGEDGNIHLRNLSVNVAQKEEDALNLLFLGDTNRVVAETPMNDASTRSHCMFILRVNSTRHDSDTVRSAKLHLVDLAGSERISKTGVEGNLQREARYINLSLHHLEQVIVALQERSQGHRTHVPYRNSTMTAVLRDSLGGNCKTVMVGAIAVEESAIDETISTCRFAQRVSSIKNNASINEEVDPQLLIKRLKKEVAELKDELKLLSNDGESEELGDKDIDECRQLVSAYLEDVDPERPFVCGSVARFNACFGLLREVYWRRVDEGGAPAGPRPQSAAAKTSSGMASAALGSLEGTVLELRRQVAQRDQELGILVGSLSKKGKELREEAPVIRQVRPAGGASAGNAPAAAQPSAQDVQRLQLDGPEHRPGSAAIPAVAAADGPAEQPDSSALLLDRNKAFEVFRKSVRRSEAVGDNKQTIAALKAEAKLCGERANAARVGIIANQQKAEKLRVERALEAGPHQPGDAGPATDSPEICALLTEIKELKGTYTQNMQRLKQVKTEMDKNVEAAARSKARLQEDFEAWYRSLQRSTEASAAPAPAFAPAPAAAAELQSTEPLRSSLRSQASSADSHARATPLRGPSPVGAPSANPVGLGAVPGHAWQEALGAPGAENAGAGVGARAVSPWQQSPSAVAAACAAGSPAAARPGPTGDDQTDSDIAAYYAAIADLQR
eukprot:TRINITY_DN3002_c0_g1_i2.p1 TRINITY_DN3002_c0_g1~~TRINITY_DN3002_c0_g1_i2.p1  ORF type:complete len:843 (+),score=248.49 TRINITY_DN3002_c0_g1_i2:111-2639(+)